MTSGRAVALAAAGGGIALAGAPYVAPAWAGFHSWQYAAALAIALTAVIGYASGARKGEDGAVGRRLVVAMLGAAVAIVAGLASGLLGPDTQTVTRAPGTVAPLPDVGAAAFFPVADAAAISRGDARMTLRRRGAAALELGPGERRYLGATALELVPQPAAYVEARDARGRRLTVTQPTNPAFLSPVLLFPQQVPIAGAVVPADAFATPARHREIKAFYFSKNAAAGKVHGRPGRPAVLFAVDDESGRLVPGGIAFAPDGRSTTVGDLVLTATAGTYPGLVISAVPHPYAFGLGLALVFAGLVYALARTGAAHRPVARIAGDEVSDGKRRIGG